MSFIVFLYASGWAFFAGAAMIVGAAFIPIRRFRWATILVLTGLFVFVAPSSVPMPLGMGFALLLVTVLWWASKNRSVYYRAILIAIWSVSGLYEGIHHLSPRGVPATATEIAVVGDSLTSGLSETKAVKWPKLLSKRMGIVVYDFAVEGATSRKAMSQAEKVPEDVAVMIVAIGGNDILGRTTLTEFERDYDDLLKKLWRPDRTLIGFELPLPPFHNHWGIAQREVARKHGVRLVPKWKLMWILADPKNTVDSIHPSQAGQDALADMVESSLKE
jgi:acyl-CoA thioesterase I